MADRSVKEPFVLDDQVGYLLRLANQRHTAIFQKSAILGLTATQFAALSRLAEIDECSQNRLGRETGMDVATIKGVVDRLRDKGLVELKPDPTDRRRLVVSPSETYWAVRDELADLGRKITEETLETLTAAEQRTLLALLKKLI